MRRKLKFRVWDKSREQWANYGLALEAGEDGFLEFRGRTLDGEDMAIQQFTGMRDKFGKDVFEGDHVSLESSSFSDKEHKSHPEDFEVVFSDALGSYLFIRGDRRICVNDGANLFSLKVIGNIFEGLINENTEI